jgi:hypothetical protein
MLSPYLVMPWHDPTILPMLYVVPRHGVAYDGRDVAFVPTVTTYCAAGL